MALALDNRMTPVQIEAQLKKSGRTLQVKNEELKELGVKKAEAEKIYRIELAKKYLELKPNYPATLVSDLARGDKYIAQLKQERDIADVLFDACREKIKDLRDEIGIMRSLLAQQRMEYENAGSTGT